ncbi:MAG: HlyD family type I secretion periplasmic adaptor subunit [Methylococcales bacterium]
MKKMLAQPTGDNAIAIVTDDTSIRNIGVIVLICTFGILGTWGYLAPIDSAALAPGFVTVKSHRKTVQHLDGGIVSEILAKDGELVKEGDVLIKLDTTETKAQVEIFRGQFITLSAQVARLTAERDHKDHVVYPEALADINDIHIREARQSEDQVFLSRKNAHEGEISVLKQRISQIDSQIKGLQGQRASKTQLVASYGEEVRDLKELLAEGFADRQRLRDIERNHALVTGEVASLTAEIAGNEIQQGETKLQILQLEKARQEEVAAKLSETQAQLYDVTQRLLATTDKVTRTEIRAPSDGRVLGLSVHNVGSVITPGHPILDIVPQTEELIIDAQVSPMDIDRVSIGLLAEVRFSAFKQVLTPKMQGKVINLSADRITDERTGNSYYQAQVELTPDSYQKLGNIELVPGMPAEVLISTGERTVFEYLVQPITNAFARAFIED